MIAAIIAAAGSGERFGASTPKALIQLGDRTLLEHSISALSSVADYIVVSAPAGYEDQIRALVGNDITVVTGGATRSESVRLALATIEKADFVLVHDAARALASRELAARVVAALKAGDVAVIPALPEVDTVKVIDANGYVTSTPDRTTLRRVQTPQGFTFSVLKSAHATASDATDDATLVAAAGHKVRVIDGQERALKITTPHDLATALQFMGSAQSFSSGVGVDAHAFGQGRELWLAGLHWPDEVGVEGHSDGDVAAHAICDALFAATGLGDLGSNFGTSRPEYAGASGIKLLKETYLLLSNAGYSISHISVQIIGNRPRIGARRAEAIATISTALGGAEVAILATTTDGMGLTGEGKGIAAIASALVIKSAQLK
ncbi:2-C-methyl-D-erythritol 4-phosphate cytidylyltransferase / 2-C-methyl-D-erythritol 2,4-cyclodiphosphate synthase [Candidatus Planktophila versatilis]|uniref:Bifunctional enzyme IspD/IspF n=1 Tax=Candidatus Planktophila versatilis TaxID=1884905 RepID=A0AAC9YV55_9ACTN|nr:2-C-methyl-D-erythritol 4-phosphate cytidylyltransferase [Candidatus Planktophila versatilis]ASY22080.1 2-C-methyl-D-erythritol 4-phosphate cytidylyltransferase / 2-C-methyl-D-erythritol 2,4-cyclodiphosphate synthase [Candidatus Planktophila versatilis]